MTEQRTTKKQEGSGKAGSARGSPPLAGLRLTADFLSPIFVGIFLGFWLDRWSGTTPLFLLLLFFLGVLAGFWNLYRMAQRLDEQNRIQDSPVDRPVDRHADRHADRPVDVASAKNKR